MNTRSLLLFGLLWLAASTLAACSFDEDANPQHNCGATCPPGQCHQGFCLSQGQNQLPSTGISGAGGSGPAAGGNGASGTGTAGTAGASGTGTSGSGSAGSDAAGSVAPRPCTPNTECFSGDPALLAVGHCRSGQCDASGTCIGELLPEAETCNATDDDCDGKVDEEIATGSCTPASGAGACATGAQECAGGVSSCRAVEPQPETCNGLDDDCDGMVDDGLDVACYPDSLGGCTADGAGGFNCAGRCALGKRSCVNGTMSQCMDAKGPSNESCGDDDPGDEDCDGKVDEGCMCSGTETQRCYTGPLFTAGVGTCRRGEQKCVNGTFGACTGSIVPVAETCSNPNADNNCNLTIDDVLTLGTDCTLTDPGIFGPCRKGTYQCNGATLVCKTPSPKPDTTCDGVDEDCDNKTDETFAFMTDEAHCGNCETACLSGDLCCGGHCVHPSTDGNNCNGCGTKCGANRACCGSVCVDVTTDQHCGGCGGCDTSAGLACCGGSCMPTNTLQHCGSCRGCNATAGEACCNRACVVPDTKTACGASCDTCEGNEACCNRTCVVPDTNKACGASCDSCDGSEQCCGGNCVVPDMHDVCGLSCMRCELNQECCGSTCVDVTTPDRCGTCGGCAPNLECCGGKSCIDTKAEDEDNCGGCGVPCAKTCCAGGCFDTQTDMMNCGSCGQPCPDGCHCDGGSCLNPGGQACPLPG